jgi:hypothetical protein
MGWFGVMEQGIPLTCLIDLIFPEPSSAIGHSPQGRNLFLGDPLTDDLGVSAEHPTFQRAVRRDETDRK